MLSLFPARILLKDELLPLRRTDGCVEVATSRLFATHGLDTLKTMTGLRLRPVLAPAEAIQREMKKRLGVGADTIDTLDEEKSFEVVDEGNDDDNNLDNAAEDASIIRFVNQVLRDAIELRASDIHLEPFEDELRIRYRIDGVLQDVPVPAQVKRFQPAIVSRVKILSHLNIAEKRLPQDGRIKIRIDDAEVDIRVSVITMNHGEAGDAFGEQKRRAGMREWAWTPAIRILPRVLRCARDIWSPADRLRKNSTLYTALHEINDAIERSSPLRNPSIPAESVNQIQVSEKAGRTFGRAGSILRHAPVVVLIVISATKNGSVRGASALRGTLSFRLLHTNVAPGAVPRLVGWGGALPGLVVLEAVLAQRLVRLLCRKCKEVDDSPAAESFKAQVGIPANTKIYRSVGCRDCRNTGFHGRRAIFEWMNTSNEIRQMVLRNASSDEIRDAARRDGMKTLADDGWRLVRLGETTVEEVLSVTTAKEVSRTHVGPVAEEADESSVGQLAVNAD